MLHAGIAATGLAVPAAPDPRRKMFLNTYVVTALNPKSIMFFVAFLPQFVDRSANVTQQLWLLAVTFVVMATLNSSMYSLFAASAHRLLSSPVAQRRLNLLGGSILTAAGVWALLARHSA